MRERRQIISVSNGKATPAVKAERPRFLGNRDYVRAGGLMSYGPILPDLFRRAAELVDKILRGTMPGDIPVPNGRDTRLTKWTPPARSLLFSCSCCAFFCHCPVDHLIWRNQTPPRPAVPELVKVKEPSVDIAINSENHIGRGRMNLGRSRFAGLAAGLCAIALLLGPGLRASFAGDSGTSTKSEETGSTEASTAPAS